MPLMASYSAMLMLLTLEMTGIQLGGILNMRRQRVGLLNLVGS